MALVTIVGYPCSGKTRLSEAFRGYSESRFAEPEYGGPRLEVIHVNDDNSHVSRGVYDSSISEKSGRGNLFTNTTRALGPSRLVICDSLNYIKGFRYQMYCAAREASVRVVTVHVATPPDKCKEWHATRGECSYEPETFDNLIMRFEEPSSMVRWDSPLVTVAWDETYPLERIFELATQGEKKGPTAAVKPRNTQAPNMVQTLTTTTSSITTALLAYLNASPTSSTFLIPSPPAGPGGLTLHLPMRRVTLPELQRLKRQFEGTFRGATVSGGVAAGLRGEAEVAAAFVRFLETSWDTA